MHLILTDIGRPISDVKTSLDVPDLDRRIMEVIRSIRTEEHEVRDKDGHWYRMNIRPYRTTDNRIDGAVVTLVDTDAIQTSRHRLLESQSALRVLLEDVPDFILAAEPLGRVLFLNRTQLSLAKKALEGDNFLDFVDSNQRAAARKTLREVVKSGTAGELPPTPTGTQSAVTRVLPIKQDGSVAALAVKTT